MVEQKNIRIIFTDKADLVLSEIMKRYNLEESNEEWLKKSKEGKSSNIVIIDKITKDFAKEIISERESVESLKKELSVPQQTAEKISKDIIDNLVPLLEKLSEEELAKVNGKEEIIRKPITAAPIKPPIGLEKTPKEEVFGLPSEKPQVAKKPLIPKITEEKVIPEKKKTKDIKTSEKEDIYREPTE